MITSLVWLLAITQGCQALHLKTRIVGGREIDITQAPYQVSLSYNGKIGCGGVILQPKIIITAAHCLENFVKNSSIVKVRAGSTMWNLGGTEHGIEKIVIHPKYKAEKDYFDVALFRIKPPLQFDTTRKPIEIMNHTPEEGDEVVLSGWGKLKIKGEHPVSLQSVTVHVTSDRICRRYENLNKGIFCFGRHGHRLCSGDSGGPVVKNSQLIGIAAGGCEGGRPSDPSYGIDLSHLEVAPWIKSTIKKCL